jgi:hypothetical protein
MRLTPSPASNNFLTGLFTGATSLFGLTPAFRP